MKKLLAILLGGCLLLGVMTGCGGNAEDAVTVQKVSDITSQGSVGLVNRYAGIVVSGETATVKKGDKKVLETYVKEGDFVTEGDVLFCYDNEAMELQLSKLLLELEGYENTISNAEEDIPNLERQRDAAPAAQQLTYSLQIQELQANVREATYNKGLKEREIENLQEALEDTDVRAPISGRVMSVKNTENTGASSGYDGDTSGSDAYITIMDMTTYQVKGTINELNVGTLSEGMNVLIRSRLDESVTWSGVLDSIDWETKVQSNNSPYYGGGGGNEMTSSSKYPFYVKLNDVTGLILGQHVYIEPDYGQQEAIALFGNDPRVYQTTVKEFYKNESGQVCGALIARLKSEVVDGRRQMVPTGEEYTVDCDLVLIAAGFTGCEPYVADAFGVELTARGTVADVKYATADPKVFACGDMRRGQSLVVWALREGRDTAAVVDEKLMGYTNL